MTYRGHENYEHGKPPVVGILLANTGTPAAPTAAAVRPYLREFLGDERVIEYPRLLWKLVLNGIILNVRPRRSAELYKRVWTDEGSPLLTILLKQAAALQAALDRTLPVPVKVVAGMRYGQPSIASALRELDAAGARRVLVFPLYPQYSATTTATTFDAVFDELKTWRWMPELRTINHYHDDPAYIRALAASVRETWEARPRPDRLLMSFHGIPRDYFIKGDPYYCECQKTARLLVDELGLAPDDYAITFQSRFGPGEWLQPYTDKTLEEWGAAGLGSVHAMSPGFSADCLETVDEIGHEGAHSFREAGGGDFHYIPALNDRPDHIAVLADIATRHLAGWLEPAAANPVSPETLAHHRALVGLTE